MDVAPDINLIDFIESLGKAEEEQEETLTAAAAPPKPKADDGDVWEDIASALDNWTQRILDTESRLCKSADFRQQIEESLIRQQKDGFLSKYDLQEIRYVADLWKNLLDATSCYAVGCAVQRDIITSLLDLHSLKQITRSAFIDACLKL